MSYSFAGSCSALPGHIWDDPLPSPLAVNERFCFQAGCSLWLGEEHQCFRYQHFAVIQAYHTGRVSNSLQARYVKCVATSMLETITTLMLSSGRQTFDVKVTLNSSRYTQIFGSLTGAFSNVLVSLLQTHSQPLWELLPA